MHSMQTLKYRVYFSVYIFGVCIDFAITFFQRLRLYNDNPDNNDADKAHDQRRCQKCQELGYLCLRRNQNFSKEISYYNDSFDDDEYVDEYVNYWD